MREAIEAALPCPALLYPALLYPALPYPLLLRGGAVRSFDFSIEQDRIVDTFGTTGNTRILRNFSPIVHLDAALADSDG